VQRIVLIIARMFHQWRKLVACSLAGSCCAMLAGPPAHASDPAFDVWEYRVRGNTVLDALRIEQAMYPLLGPGKTIDDVQRAREKLEQLYREAGYPTVLVNVPEQDTAGGVVRLDVTEGRVGRVLVSGARYFDNGWIRAQLPELGRGVPRLERLQGELALLRARSVDREVTPVLRPGRERGTVDFELKVADQLPLHASAEVNNRSAVLTETDSRVRVGFGYGNLWQREHALNLSFEVAPEEDDDSKVWVGSYEWKPGLSDRTMRFYLVDSQGTNNFAPSAGGVGRGNAQILGAEYLRPLPGSATRLHNLTFGAAFKDLNDLSVLQGVVTPSSIDYLNWSLGYDATMLAEGRAQTAAAAINFGLRDIVNSTEEFEAKRFKGSPNYAYLTGRYEVSQRMPAESALNLGLSGQISGMPLIGNEQFSAGGAGSVRGYYEGELRGDYGLQATIEYRSPNLGPKLRDGLSALEAFTFVDWASLRSHDPLPDEDTRFTLWSAGLGLRASGYGLVASLEWALPFKDGFSSETSIPPASGSTAPPTLIVVNGTESGDDRVLFRLQYGF
jgi:hemolysin activation/secretion protein